ncbi:MAG TPA: hypothetical protein VFO41_17545 [Alphaproteobacteria bacterium]|nr:hypothetical protein [Alphaproteobacteria bacterium]
MPTMVVKNRNDRIIPSGSTANDAATESGVTIVPSKPTAAMLAAGARAGGVTVETAWKVYQAMIRDG